jgi:hypothetical protein
MPDVPRGQPQWVHAAQRLRAVRSACSVFLDRWAVNKLLTAPRAIDRVAIDLQKAIADPHNHDWSFLYRGSVLDD